MPFSQRLPEPTDIRSLPNATITATVDNSKLQSYLHQLLRVLKISFEEAEEIPTMVVKVLTTSSSNSTVDASAYQWNGDTDGAAFKLTLPPGVQGREYRFANVGTSGNSLEVGPDGSELLRGTNASTFLSDGEVLTIVYDITNGWY